MESNLKKYESHEEFIESLTAEIAGREIRKGMTDIAKKCVLIGFYLKAVRDRELYREAGYSSMWDYAADQFGLSMSSTSRYIAINDRFSVGGNTPYLLPKYSKFSKSQLQEMLNMSPEQIGQVTEDMTVKEIRKLKNPEPEKTETEQDTREESIATSQQKISVYDSCPPGIGQCIRQEWGLSPEQQHNGHKECTKCWREWEKRESLLEAAEKEKKPLSVYGLPLKEYPEDSLLATPGCGTHDCFNCHQAGCGIRQQFCYCVEAPMANPFPCEMLDVVSELQVAEPDGCQFLDHSLAYHRAGDGEAVPCCKSCENLCEYACERAKKALGTALPAPEEPEQENSETQPEPDIVEEPEETGLSDMELLRSMLKKENEQLSEYLKVDKVEKLPEDMIRKKKIIVAALASMLYDLEENGETQEPIQPDLPPMKNSDQRKEWLRNYKDWGLWYEDNRIGVKYYKYDFENGARLIAETYMVPETEFYIAHESCYFHLVGGPEPVKKNGVPKWGWNEVYNRYPNSETELVEFLKEAQKKGGIE